MILVQISDTHIGDADELVYGQFDTAAALTSAVDYINNMVPTIVIQVSIFLFNENLLVQKGCLD